LEKIARMNQPRRHNPTAIALYLVAALLALNIIITLSRDSAPSFLPAAYAQRQPPIAGGAGLYVMPAQLSGNTWGAYLLDVDRGTLCVYQFFPGAKQLQFVAARNFVHDQKLKNFNTTPPPQDIADLVEKEAKAIRPAAGDDEQQRP
jgi:hypothetical protein